VRRSTRPGLELWLTRDEFGCFFGVKLQGGEVVIQVEARLGCRDVTCVLVLLFFDGLDP